VHALPLARRQALQRGLAARSRMFGNVHAKRDCLEEPLRCHAMVPAGKTFHQEQNEHLR
jgi:hypothetical protein